MPDFTHEMHQQCANSTRTGNISGYVQYVDVTGERDHCTCDGFKYHKDCKHLKELRKQVCDWNSFYTMQHSQTPEQEEKQICPACGHGTDFVRIAV